MLHSNYRCEKLCKILDFSEYNDHISLIMSKNFILETSRKNFIRISAYNHENISNLPCIIIVHGFKGFKDWGFFPFAAKYFANKGFFVLTFNFSHNGVGDNLLDFTELNKFAANTYSLELEELNEIIDNYSKDFFGEVKNKKIGLLGHSRGGGVSILAAAERNDINSLAVWASISRVDRYNEQQKIRWRKDGFLMVQNARTKQEMKMNVTALDDIEANKDDSLNIKKAVKNLKCPFLIAHGQQDLSVKISEAEDLHNWSDHSYSEIFKIPGTGHTFDVVHPFTGSNSKLDILLDKTTNFFKINLI